MANRRIVSNAVILLCLWQGYAKKSDKESTSYEEPASAQTTNQIRYVLPQGSPGLLPLDSVVPQVLQQPYDAIPYRAESKDSAAKATKDKAAKKSKGAAGPGPNTDQGYVPPYETKIMPIAQKTGLVWHDEFVGNGKPDAAFWDYGDGDEDSVYTTGHMLYMTASRDSSQSTAAHLTTKDRVTFTYGTLEARIKIPDLTPGLWATFWTLGDVDGSETWPSMGEIDIMEMGYNDTSPPNYINRRVRSTAHFHYNGNHVAYSKDMISTEDLSQDFHVYRLEWTNETMTTYVDDEWLWQININPNVCLSCTEFHRSHHIHLNLAVGGRFGCVVNCSYFARGEMLVDYVRLYDNGHTKGTVNGYRNGGWINTVRDGANIASATKKGSAKKRKGLKDSRNPDATPGQDPVPGDVVVGKIPIGGRRRLATTRRKGARNQKRFRGGR